MWGISPPQTARSRDRTGAIGRVLAGIAPLLPSTDERRARPHRPSDAGARDIRYSETGSADRWNVAAGRRVLALSPSPHHSAGPMPTSLPRSVREHPGDQVADDLSRWFTENVQQELVTNDEYREVLSRLDVLEERFDHVEDRFDRVDERLDRTDERLNQMDERLDAMNAQMNERFDAMNERMDERSEQMTDQLDQMNDRILSMTRWLIGLLVVFGSMVTVLLAIAQFGS